MDEEQPNFKVTDRRLFNSDGSPRYLPPADKPEPQVSVAAEAATGGKTAETQVKTEPAAAPEPEPHTEEEFTEADLEDARDPTSFVSFIRSEERRGGQEWR